MKKIVNPHCSIFVLYDKTQVLKPIKVLWNFLTLILDKKSLLIELKSKQIYLDEKICLDKTVDIAACNGLQWLIIKSRKYFFDFIEIWAYLGLVNFLELLVR